jgi:hypothetical protein
LVKKASFPSCRSDATSRNVGEPLLTAQHMGKCMDDATARLTRNLSCKLIIQWSRLLSLVKNTTYSPKCTPDNARFNAILIRVSSVYY